MEIRQNIDSAIMLLGKGNMESIVISNLEMGYDHGEKVSKMISCLNKKEKKIVDKFFFYDKKKNLLRKKIHRAL